MQSLAELTQRGDYIIQNVLGEKGLVHRLNEMGLNTDKKITVLSLATKSSGLVVYFQGQRFAMSLDIAQRIVVSNVHDPSNVKLRSLADLAIGTSGIIKKIVGDKRLRRRLLDMGLTSDTVIKINQVAPLGDPIELLVRGYKLSLRKRDASCVLIEENV
uniref:FeoA family protein n=1 Tax=Lentilactobacillus hilgardii TaxID=1588 RepID=UPI00403F015E